MLEVDEACETRQAGSLACLNNAYELVKSLAFTLKEISLGIWFIVLTFIWIPSSAKGEVLTLCHLSHTIYDKWQGGDGNDNNNSCFGR